MAMNNLRSSFLLCAVSLSLLTSVSCGGGGEEEEDTTYNVTGTVIDYSTGQALSGTATITTEGIDPAPTIAIDGAKFTISEVPKNTTFTLVIGNNTEHQTKHTVMVGTANATIDPVHVPQSYIDDLAGDVAVTPSLNQGIVIVQVVDLQGNPESGVGREQFDILGDLDADDIYFIDSDGTLNDGLDETQDNGKFVLFNVPPGSLEIAAVDLAKDKITFEATVTAGTTVVADLVFEPFSFAAHIVPFFSRCSGCHRERTPERDPAANMSLVGTPSEIHGELMADATEPGERVNTSNGQAATSLLLRKPLSPNEDGVPDDGIDDGGLPHTGGTHYSGLNDTMYRTILAWIVDGAPNN